MAEKPLLSLGVASERLGVKPVTLRRWAEYHAVHLSAVANPAKNVARQFDSRDIQVLSEVKALRFQGLSVSAINDKLAGLMFASVIDSEIADDTPGPGEYTTAIASTGTHTGQGETQALIMVVQGVESRIAAVERSQRQGYITAVGVGFCIGLLFMLCLIALASLYGTP